MDGWSELWIKRVNLVLRMDTKLPEGMKDLCQAFLGGLNAALGDKLYGVYLYGAVAFPESGPTGDIDFHVIVKETLSSEEELRLKDLDTALARDFPPLGAELDGYYILLEEARQTSPPRHQLRPDVTDNSWALHREHIRAGRCITLQGPDPKEVYPSASWLELEDALGGELQYVENHLSDYPDYCILNLCRLMYSFERQDVVISKVAAAAWAWESFPEWRRHIELAKKSYAGQATAEEKQFMMTEVGNLYRFACERIQQSRDNRNEM
jgi:hypothetical protein